MSTLPAVTLDVRNIEPRHRHPLIFGVFDALPQGEVMLLSNDHDPKPLYYQFRAESAGQFSWDYLEQGPDQWQVLISKTSESIRAKADAHCCGAIGN